MPVNEFTASIYEKPVRKALGCDVGSILWVKVTSDREKFTWDVMRKKYLLENVYDPSEVSLNFQWQTCRQMS